LVFVAWASDLAETIPQKLAVRDQLERAAMSVPLNIAEANGKFTPPDRCQYFDIARGSALECAACLDVLAAKRLGNGKDYTEPKQTLAGIVSMLVGLIRSSSPDRLHEQEDEQPERESDRAAANPGTIFDHEKLDVYGCSLDFIRWTTNGIERFSKIPSIWNSIDRASTSIPLNIAEGNGKFTPFDRCRFFDNGRRGTLDCAASLDVMVAKQALSIDAVEVGKQQLSRIHSMLVGLIRRNAPDRFEKPVRYRLDRKRQSQEKQK
jgi:four helix bundle protein